MSRVYQISHLDLIVVRLVYQVLSTSYISFLFCLSSFFNSFYFVLFFSSFVFLFVSKQPVIYYFLDFAEENTRYFHHCVSRSRKTCISHHQVLLA